MALYAKLLKVDGQGGIAVHTFMACLAELQRGQLTRAQVDSLLGLTAGEAIELTAFLAAYFTGNVATRLLAALALHDVLLIGNLHRGLYDTELTLRARLGV
jgi:hypothetical protein